ncbi:methyl-accepting chemotaxis protein [Cytobacillus eiseniae]|uniref:Methyl-accepting chemotaxis protein n=1 Tax=Cytobacillus eiseniae TaxID=762947 RepID=A0ABS4RD54_9BACI|nr:methyl-accepting chemotaxis protein [Cytobacillus eiseniae]MBP2240269.1 methyl-accepting chemotaxis protein [Cytobacillus eiseniae]
MKITVRKKLIFGFIIVLMLFGIVAGISNYELKRINDRYTNLLNEGVQNLLLVKNFKEDLTIESNGIRGYLLSGESTYITDYDMARKRLDQQLDVLAELIVNEEAQSLITDLKKLHGEFAEITEAALFYKIEGNEAAYLELIQTSAKEVGQAFSLKADELIKYEETRLTKESEKNAEAILSTQLTVIIISIASFIFAIGIAIFISRMITRPIQMAAKSMDQIANGELHIEEVKVKSKDEIGSLIHSLNSMVKDLRKMVSQIRGISTHLTASSEELASSAEQSTDAAEQVSQISQQNVASIEQQITGFQEVATAVHEMDQSIHAITKSSEEMLEVTNRSNHLSSKGEQSIERVFIQMNEVSQSVQNATKSIQLLEVRSDEISNISSIITNIAEQTNLLALNAAIEAARAGEHGKGFAVVADEVRKLAEESKKSAIQIQNMIGMIQQETNLAVGVMDVGNKQVTDMFTETKEARNAFKEIAETMLDTAGMVENINYLLGNLSVLSEQITVVITNVEEISKNSVSASEDASAATEEQLATMEEVFTSSISLAKLADEMQTVVSRFKL